MFSSVPILLLSPIAGLADGVDVSVEVLGLADGDDDVSVEVLGIDEGDELSVGLDDGADASPDVLGLALLSIGCELDSTVGGALL